MTDTAGTADPPPSDEPSEPRAADPHEVARAARLDPGEATALAPSPMARLLGVVAIVVAGAAGGFIGYAVTDLQCSGDCTVPNGIGGLVGAVIGAIGVGIVVQLALRAMYEWRAIEARGGREAERQRQRASERRQPPRSRPHTRVR